LALFVKQDVMSIFSDGGPDAQQQTVAVPRRRRGTADGSLPFHPSRNPPLFTGPIQPMTPWHQTMIFFP
jgi:hypothetical protein